MNGIANMYYKKANLLNQSADCTYSVQSMSGNQKSECRFFWLLSSMTPGAQNILQKIIFKKSPNKIIHADCKRVK